MKPVEEIARWIEDRKCRRLNDPDTEGCPVQPDQCECEMLDAIAAALRAESEKHACPIGLDATPTVCSAGTCVRCLNDRIVWLTGRAEKAEAERDEVLWDARFQIDAQVKSREAAEARAEKAEAERDEKVTDLFDRLRDVEAERDVAESALATARNRALEEAAQARPVTPHGSPKSWEQGYADGTSEFADAILALRTKEGE